jgi:hypothetical protein
MSDCDPKGRDPKGLTRRELFKSVGGGAALAGLSGAALAQAQAQKASAPVLLGPGKENLTLRVNGKAHAVEVEPRHTLLCSPFCVTSSI